MGLNYGSLVVADAKIVGLHGVNALGGYQLRLSIEFSPTSGSEHHVGVVLGNVIARIHAGGSGTPLLYMGRAFPEAPLWLQARTNRHTLLFDLDLSDSQFAALERSRKGGQLAFRVDLTAEGSRNSERMPAHASLPYTCHLEEWSRVLKELGFGNLVVFGIPLPPNPKAGPYAAAAQALSRAQDDYVRGRYDDVVARTRKIVEEIWAVRGDTAKLAAATVEKYRTDKKGMTKVERSLFVQEAIRHYAHPPHHAGGDSDAAWYSNSDAALSLGMASAFLAEALAREDLLTEDGKATAGQ
jgi:hypothetical protein